MVKSRLNSQQAGIVMKSTANAGVLSPANGTNELTGQAITITVDSGNTAKAHVTLSIGVSASNDFEFYLYCILNSTTVVLTYTPAASMSGGRAHSRTLTGVIDLPAGVNTIHPRLGLISGAGYSIAANGVNFSAIAIGRVS